MLFHRDAYLQIMTFGQPTRPMFVELFGLLIGLEEEWRAQGASQDEIDLVAFDWDYVSVVGCGGSTGYTGGQAGQVLEDTPDYLLSRDEMGRTIKLLKGYATIALPLDFPVTDLASWRKIKPHYEFSESRIDWAQVENARRLQAQGALVIASIPGGFDTPRELMGDAAACLAYYEQPALMHEIIETLSDTAYQVLDRISQALVIDQLSVHEDLAGKSGPLIGPRQVKQFIRPYYRRIWDLLSSRGTRIFEMDTDGNPTPVLDAFLESGLNSMHPMEPAAGVDVVELRKKYGSALSMKGGIDKHVLRTGQDAIRAELEYKMQPLMRQGGFVFGLDHRIPNGTPLASYRYYADTGRQILGLPPRDGRSKGWARMAF